MVLDSCFYAVFLVVPLYDLVWMHVKNKCFFFFLLYFQITNVFDNLSAQAIIRHIQLIHFYTFLSLI